jgi:hypothetical protein
MTHKVDWQSIEDTWCAVLWKLPRDPSLPNTLLKSSCRQGQLLTLLLPLCAGPFMPSTWVKDICLPHVNISDMGGSYGQHFSEMSPCSGDKLAITSLEFPRIEDVTRRIGVTTLPETPPLQSQFFWVPKFQRFYFANFLTL